MAKCASCQQRKGNRYCTALERDICSQCCGSKREKEIACFSACSYLKKGIDYQLGREIEREIRSAFQTGKDDVFQIDEIADFVLPIEGSFVEWFYQDGNVNDGHLYDALAKVYASRTGRKALPEPGSRCEELVFEICREADIHYPKITADLKNKAILRILQSIKSSSGGVLGNRNYLDMIYSQFHQEGKWASLFEDLGKKAP